LTVAEIRKLVRNETRLEMTADEKLAALRATLDHWSRTIDFRFGSVAAILDHFGEPATDKERSLFIHCAEGLMLLQNMLAAIRGAIGDPLDRDLLDPVPMPAAADDPLLDHFVAQNWEQREKLRLRILRHLEEAKQRQE
jgi:hypothetical protein